MASLKANDSLRDFQRFTETVYGANNRKHFTIDEMLTNIERFTMRGLKGIRKHDEEKIVTNLLVAMSWFLSLSNLLDIDLQAEVWKRFPYQCSYCGSCPCVCRLKKIRKRSKKLRSKMPEPRSFDAVQEMFGKIYPSSSRTLEDAGIHLAEEMGELAEAVLRFRGTHSEEDFKEIRIESADLLSCFIGVFNTLAVSVSKHRAESYSHGCPSCKKIPCACTYGFIIGFKS